jgi:2-oxo-3-hexenedioate decarboxylase
VDASDDRLDVIASQLLDAAAGATTVAPVSGGWPEFDDAGAYDVGERIARARVADGWRLAGRKIGFTNTTIWELYGVDRPMWARMWDRTVVHASSGEAQLALDRFVQPRIEPELVFKLRAEVPATTDPVEILSCVEWMAAGFEIVHCHFPGWAFTIADCTADFGLHGALILGEPVAIRPEDRSVVAAQLETFGVTLHRDGVQVATGTGANVLGSPARALGHLRSVLDGQPASPPLTAGEIVTTGTITDAWPIRAGETWTSVYDTLGIQGLTVTFT